MKIIRFRVYRFTLPLKRTLVIGMNSVTHREGMIVEIATDGGRSALGEVSPLPGVSGEDVEQARAELIRTRSAMIGQRVPSGMDRFSGAMEAWLTPYGLSPSVRFGVETALAGLVAGGRGISLGRLLSHTCRGKVRVNALLTGEYEKVLSEAGRLRDEGFTAFKVKVGGRPLEESVSLVAALRSLIGPSAVLRIDANRAWDLDQAVSAVERLAGFTIDYIEEPVQTVAMLEVLTSGKALTVPFALDESLAGADPDRPSFPPNVGAIVLKPTVLGLEKTVRWARQAARQGIKSVISSAFESGYGLKVLSHLAASLNDEDVPAGLGTASWFAADLLPEPLRMEGGRLPVDPLPEEIGELREVCPA